jgi:pimeloyl-ACP methyl ester carboxylesterase
MARPTATLTASPPQPDAPPLRRGPIGWIVAGSLFVGVVAALVLVAVIFAGAREHVITGTALLGFALGWALLALLSTRWTSQPQRWALVPAAVLAGIGLVLVLLAPGASGMTVLGWVWPPILLVLAGWMPRQARRHLAGWTRPWLIYPVCVLTGLVAVAGGVETIHGGAAPSSPSAAGQAYDVGGHRLYLECTGTGSPTVVLSAGYGSHTPSWAWITPQVARDTRVCAYDRAGEGRSEPASGPQDGVAIAADLHALLARANVPGPYVLAGHSVGGTYALIFAARYPAEVAGMVLLDSSSPQQFSLPGYPGLYDMLRRATALFPSLSRLGLARAAFGSGFAELPAAARDQERAFAVSADELRGQRDEWSQLPAAFRQSQSLTDFAARPLLIVTAGKGQDPGWSAAQDNLAALSTNSAHRTVAGATHEALLIDRGAAADSAQGIRDVVTAVRTGGVMQR